MTRFQRILLVLLSMGLVLVWGALIFQIAQTVQPSESAPLAAATSSEGPAATRNPLRLPATWTPTLTSPPMTLPPRSQPSATPSSSPTPIPALRPTSISVTLTYNPSGTLTIPSPVPLQTIPDNAITILLLGSDQRPDWEDWHTDAIQYVVIYPDIPAVSILSIPRDLYVYIPNFWMSRINFADMYGETSDFEGGGLGLMNQTLLYNLGISADYYAMVDFDGLIGVVDLLGGIDVPVHCRLEDYWPYPDEKGEYYRIALEPGLQHMDGELALWYSRSRKTTSVFSRERRQQQVLEAIWRKAKAANLLEAVPSLYEQTQDLLETNLGLGNILSLAATAAQLDPADIKRRNIGWNQVRPYTTPYGGGVYLPIWEEIEPIIADILQPPAANRASQNPIWVEVWNGTENPDWDYLAADRLYRSGFFPLISPADRHDYPQTQLFFFGETTKGSGLEWLQSLFNVAEKNLVLQANPDPPARLRLIIGADYVTCPPY